MNRPAPKWTLAAEKPDGQAQGELTRTQVPAVNYIYELFSIDDWDTSVFEIILFTERTARYPGPVGEAKIYS